jgi:hypothetical protein
MWKILENILFSILIIIFLHYLFNHYKNNYSPQRTNDIIKSQTNKYKNMIDEIIKKQQATIENETPKEDLTLFLQEQLLLQDKEEIREPQSNQ